MPNTTWIKQNVKVQAGKETTWGTVVAQTVKLMGVEEVRLTPHVEIAPVQDVRASMAPAFVTQIGRKWGELNLKGMASYEDVPYLMDALIDTATPSVSTEYTYAYEVALTTASDVPRYQTIAVGTTSDNIYSLLGSTLKTLKFTARGGEPLRYDATFIGADVVSDTWDALSDRSVNFIMAGNPSIICIDPGSDAIGTTTISDAAWDFDLTIETNRALRWYLGDTAAGDYYPGQWDISLKLKLELNATSLGYFDAILATTGDAPNKNIRFKFGAAVASDSYFQIDLGLSLLEAPEIFTDDDGVLTLEFNAKGIYTSGLSNFLKATVVNGLAALP